MAAFIADSMTDADPVNAAAVRTVPGRTDGL
jgi:hypothetical protein